MALQLLLQTYKIAKKFIGLRGELRADSSNWALILDDAAKEGGHRFLNVDSNDERYQARSPELDGLLGFEPQNRGVLVRRGPADYRTRTLRVDTANLKLTEPDGFQGDPTFALAETIESNHTFDGVQTFTQPVKAEGGLEGNVTGDLVGNVTGDLVGDSAGAHTGSVDTRGATLQLDANQVARAWLDESTRNALVPAGCIIMWWGAKDAIPAGWLLCDGTQGTPDLRGRFVAGAGGELDVGDFGGATSGGTGVIQTSAAGAHDHGTTTGDHALTVDQMPTHKHGTGVVDKNDNLFNHGGFDAVPTKGDSIDGNSSTGKREGWSTTVGGGLPHAHGIAVAPNHTHEVNLEFEIIPPYFALCYIMKGIG